MLDAYDCERLGKKAPEAILRAKPEAKRKYLFPTVVGVKQHSRVWLASMQASVDGKAADTEVCSSTLEGRPRVRHQP